MKKNILLLTTLMFLFITACSNLDDGGIPPENGVYMENPNSSGVISMLVSSEKGGSAFVTPRLANITEEPVKITIGVDQKILDEYNNLNSLDIEPILSEDFLFVTKDGKESRGEAVITIEKGEYQGSLEIRLDKVDEEKYALSKRFAIPVIIKDASKYNVLSSPRWTIVRLDRQIKTSVGLMSGGNIQLKPKTPFTTPMTEWTFQMSVIYSSLTRGNLTTGYISDHGGGEFYTRIHQTTGIQIKNGRDGDDTWTQKPLNAGEWLNITYVFKNQSVTVYVNGEFQKTFSTTPIYLNNTDNSGWVIGNDGYNNDYIREVRFWDRALTEAEIIDKLYLPQDPETPGLLLYMPVTKETEIQELTGSWNVTTAGTTSISYVDNVVFPADRLVIEE